MGESLGQVSALAGDACYAALAAVGLWGTFCVILVWRRLSQMRFRNEADQAVFLNQVETALQARDFDRAAQITRDDPHALAQLARVALDHRGLGYSRVRHLVVDLFQRDVLADLQHRVSWIYTVIKTAPMLGLFGTVLGMMAAFGKLSSGDKVDPSRLSADISLALITTAIGLSIAIPLSLCVASINIRIRKLEDQVAVGLGQFLESFKAAMTDSH